MNEPLWWYVAFSTSKKLDKYFTYQSNVSSYKAIVKLDKEVKLKFVEDSF